MGIRVRGDRNCTVTRHYLDSGDGTVSEAFSCDQPERPTSAYDAYASRTLAYLAYGDAEAASTLGKRLVETDPARARALILRALALQPQDIEPAMWLASQAYSLRGSTAAARRATADSYILTRIVKELGGDVAVTWIVEDLKESGFEEADLARLDARVARDLRRIGDIQLEVLGERTIREDLR
jgi:predicted Zn-dependent protease